MSTQEETERGGTRAEIMEATYRALCTHGYADLTIQSIAEEFTKSKSLLYYHYDSKDDLLVDFLDYMLDRFVEKQAVNEDCNPDAQLRSFVEKLLPSEPTEDQHRFRVALLELRAQAPHDEAYREQFRKSDRVVHETIADHVRVAIDRGQYRDVDPDDVAEYVHAAVNGAILRGVTLADYEASPTIRRALDGYLDSLQVADE